MTTCSWSSRFVAPLFSPVRREKETNYTFSGFLTVSKQGMATSEMLFIATVYLLKLSTLALIQELFCNNTSTTVKTALSILKYLTVICATASVTGTLYNAFPTDPNLDWTPERYYKNKVNGMFNFTADVVLDFIIFLLPIWQLFPLRLASRKKGSVMLAFGLGFL